MKQLRQYIEESLLDIDDNINTDIDFIGEIKKFIKDKFSAKGVSISKKLGEDGKYIVNANTVMTKTSDLDSLTNGYFNWGTIALDFFCDHSNIYTLEGGPSAVGRIFSCSFCKNLKSLKGAPKLVGGKFYCRKMNFTEEDVRKVTKTKLSLIHI